MFKIGDFSKLTRVSIRMLRHYDDINLLKPHKVDDITKYRFYSVEQIIKINQIQVLKEMGFTLSEICHLMERRLESKDFLILLENRKREISKVINKENEKLLRVETLIKFIEEENSVMKYDISIKSIPKYKVLSLRSIIPNYNSEGLLWEELGNFAEKNNIPCTGPNYAIYYDEGYKDSNVDVEVAMCIKDDCKDSDRIKIRELEEVKEMAIIFHKGPFEEMKQAFHSLGIWMTSNNYKINGYTRAIYHKGPWCEENPLDYLTEIQMPVTKNS
jgi:effector-binding domain-containing protein